MCSVLDFETKFCALRKASFQNFDKTSMLPRQFQNLIKHFTKFPGIGSRQATRFAFHLLRQSPEQFQDFLDELANLKKDIKICPNCFFILAD